MNIIITAALATFGVVLALLIIIYIGIVIGALTRWIIGECTWDDLLNTINIIDLLADL